MTLSAKCREEEKKKKKERRERRARGGLNSLAEERCVFLDVRVASRDTRTRAYRALERGRITITRFARNLRRNWHKVSFGPPLFLFFFFPLSLSLFTLSDLGKEPRDNSSWLCLNYLLGSSFANYGY